MRMGAFLASLFWVCLYVFHEEGHSWYVSAFLSLVGMIAGCLIAYGVTLAIESQKEKS